MNTRTALEYHPTIKDLPAGERPRERLKKYGAGSLSNAELLAIILRTGVGGENVLNLATRLLAPPESEADRRAVPTTPVLPAWPTQSPPQLARQRVPLPAPRPMVNSPRPMANSPRPMAELPAYARAFPGGSPSRRAVRADRLSAPPLLARKLR